MGQIISCRVRKYLKDAVEVRLDNGVNCILQNDEISDLSVPVEEKVYINQRLTVMMSIENKRISLRHKCLLRTREAFLAANRGNIVKARVVFTSRSGIMLELDSNTFVFMRDMHNLRKGTMLWVTITERGKIMADSVLYDDDIRLYPEYKYILPEIAASYTRVAA